MSDDMDAGRAKTPSVRRRLRYGFAAAGFVVVAVAIALGLYVHSLGPAPLGRHLAYSRLVVDRNGKLLRAYATEEGRWRLPATVRTSIRVSSSSCSPTRTNASMSITASIRSP